jgi:carbonic anhydrase/acetyltransferase-like protein (isoleucine patch superfamily)
MSRQLLFRPELVHSSVYLAAGVRILGDVTIEEEASVWYNAVIRGELASIKIGKRTNVQDGCVLHSDPGYPCILGSGVTVSHASVVHGATVEDNVTIGIRAVVMNGARIGAGSIIGVGAVVTAGSQIPPGSLVLGLPARVKRQLAPEEIERNRQTAAFYVKEARAFREAAEKT